MKNLKFRIWDIKNKIIISSIKTSKDIGYVDFDIKTDGKITREILNKDFISLDRTTTEDQDNYIVQQFIGLKDKNNKGIYEGDVVNFTVLGWPHACEPDYVKNAEVWFSEEDAMFVFGRFKTFDNLDYFYSFADRIDKNSLEIIGNIFEDSKLLKKNKIK